jgi:hypothetical protein
LVRLGDWLRVAGAVAVVPLGSLQALEARGTYRRRSRGLPFAGGLAHGFKFKVSLLYADVTSILPIIMCVLILLHVLTFFTGEL